MPCYPGGNKITPEERLAIWKWAKENGIDKGMTIDQVHDAINKHFYGGQAKEGWIEDVLSGRKTPFKHLADDMWKKQYNRRVISQQAEDMVKIAGMGKLGKVMRGIWALPRTLAVAGHGVVFPITHGGDLLFRPASWGVAMKGIYRTYRGAIPFGPGETYVGKALNSMQRDQLYDLGLRSGLDIGPRSHATGLLSRTFRGPAARAWDMLTVMRFELWKKQMGKFLDPDMTPEERLDMGQQLANWANHATGSGKGFLTNIGKGGGLAAGDVLFGPKLTQSKLNRLTTDVYQTGNTFARMMRGDKTVTAGERAVAWTRLSGATQFLLANAGFLAVNQGLLHMIGSKQKVNYTDPTASDYWAFKGAGLQANVPGMHSEIHALAKVLAISFASKTGQGKMTQLLSKIPGLYNLPEMEREWYKEARGESKLTSIAKVGGRYALSKLQPGLTHGIELMTGENWQGRPLPFTSAAGAPGTPKEPRMSWGEYAASMGPIPLEGPIGYVFDQLRKNGASSQDALSIVKSLIVTGFTDPKALTLGAVGATGMHVSPEYHPGPTRAPSRGFGMQTTQAPPKTVRQMLNR